MSEPTLHLTVRTPHEIVLEENARSIRVPTETGLVGLRPRMEPVILAIEPQLVFVRTDSSTRFVGTAGGLLTCDGDQVTLMTPLAVVGDDEATLQAELQRILSQPGQEMQARAMLDRLEGRILNEIRSNRAGDTHSGVSS
jgi:F0F1-type ATP synthase epsilon subunit